MELRQEKDPAGAAISGAGQDSCVTNNPLRRPWLRQAGSGEPPKRRDWLCGLTPDELGRAKALHDWEFAVRCGHINDHYDMVSLAGNIARAYLAPTAKRWYLPRLIHQCELITNTTALELLK
jgi:hypothetical protein